MQPRWSKIPEFGVLKDSLHHDPRERIDNIVELKARLELPLAETVSEVSVYKFVYRLAPGVAQKHCNDDEDDLLNQLLLELREGAAFDLPPNNEGKRDRISIRTRSYDLIVVADSSSQDHFVIISLTDQILRRGRQYIDERYWSPELEPQIYAGSSIEFEKRRSKQALDKLYEDFQSYLSKRAIKKSQDGADRYLSEWQRVIEALRQLEKDRHPHLPYSDPNKEGDNLTVKVLDVAELSINDSIIIKGRDYQQVIFRGEVIAIRGKLVTIHSTRFQFSSIDIPNNGNLERDWGAALQLIDRQQSAVQKFSEGLVASSDLADSLLNRDLVQEKVVGVPPAKYFDRSLNEEKQEAIAFALGHPPLQIVHGPPGTGKTTLIVELIRQELAQDSNARILVVSQTHVAIDNVLEKLEGLEASGQLIRVQSGKSGSENEQNLYSIDARCDEIEATISKRNEEFLETYAQQANIDLEEIKLAKDVSEFAQLLETHSEQTDLIERLENELKSQHRLRESQGIDSTQADDLALKIDNIERQLNSLLPEKDRVSRQLKVLKERVRLAGEDGAALAEEDLKELREWCNLWFENPEYKSLKELLILSEEWRLRYAGSKECRKLAIESASIVSGTCTGYVREDLVAKRAILVGDHKQLPAVIEFALKTKEIQDRYNFSSDLIELQLFEKLIFEEKVPISPLTNQYRMRGAIGDLISQCFYDKKLQTKISDQDLPPFGNLAMAGLKEDVVWVDTSAKGKSAYEERENHILVILAKQRLFSKFLSVFISA